MDTKADIRSIPAHEAPDVVWRSWANAYPTFRASGLECVAMEPRRAVFGLDESRFPLNPNGAVNGGVVSLAADQVMGALAARVTPTGVVPVTATLHVQYHLPALPPLTLEAEAVAGGRVIQAIEVIVSDGEGRRCCSAMGTMAVGPVRRSESRGGA